MADPADLLKAWQNAIRDVGGVAASLASGPAGVAGDLMRPLQHQAEVLEQVLQRQLDFERELLNRAAAPLHSTLELIDQVTGTLHAQATSFRAASTSFHQLAALMDQQADLLERAGNTMRDPLAAFRSTGGQLPRDAEGSKRPVRSRSGRKPPNRQKGKS
jgi:methyl-accepting chemotaxis protein